MQLGYGILYVPNVLEFYEEGIALNFRLPHLNGNYN
jgi:hypothetical protein